MNPATMSRQEAVDDLVGTSCKGCGAPKKSGMSHCRSCYFKLPRAMRAALYRRVGNGYEQAYADSLKCLKEKEAKS